MIELLQAALDHDVVVKKVDPDFNKAVMMIANRILVSGYKSEIEIHPSFVNCLAVRGAHTDEAMDTLKSFDGWHVDIADFMCCMRSLRVEVIIFQLNSQNR